jgi:ABC-type amino acid transport substrate-binding protein
LRCDGGDVVVVQEFEPIERSHFAVAVPQTAHELREALNGAIRALIGDGVVARIFASYGVSYVEP